MQTLDLRRSIRIEAFRGNISRGSNGVNMESRSAQISRRDLIAGTAMALAASAVSNQARAASADATPALQKDWKSGAPRDEIRPEFAIEASGGPERRGCLVIRTGARDGLDGWWSRTFPIVGGKHY